MVMKQQLTDVRNAVHEDGEGVPRDLAGGVEDNTAEDKSDQGIQDPNIVAEHPDDETDDGHADGLDDVANHMDHHGAVGKVLVSVAATATGVRVSVATAVGVGVAASGAVTAVTAAGASAVGVCMALRRVGVVRASQVGMAGTRRGGRVGTIGRVRVRAGEGFGATSSDALDARE